ncbi:YjiH family protein, partial [Anaerosalibacter bizertensis]|nr:YjiH family protein [Anaerosalibacter bizertensis]
MIVTIIISITAIGSIIYKVFKPSFIKDNKTLKGIFDVNMFWLITRIVGMAFAIIVFFNVGPKWITSEDIGGLILY